ncbi:DUF1648 domain-containing protein [Raoultibacter timonensis]|uniref:DUF1648 domain-containing protein n=1 Tax=Raoultibacter timonensis TaxID=1907662 RepID=UPI001FD30CFB|nr:DUF1648 domain-containing protein [Raoultibacter timonensis]
MNASMDTTVIMGLTIVLVPIVGVLMALTPYLMKKSECFTVTIPESAANDPYLKGLKRRYLAIMLVFSAALTAVGFALIALSIPSGVLAIVVVGTLGICVVGYALMLHYRKKVSTYKAKQGWRAEAQEAVAVVGERDVPRAISLKWSLLYVPVLLVTLGVGIAGYASMPDVIPMQVGFDGEVSRWVDKSPFIVFMPVLIQLFMIACLVFSHWNILRSKRLSDPNAPATSALAYGMFARAQSIFLLAMGLAICIAIILMPLSFIGLVSLMQGAVVIMVVCLFIVVGGIAISVVYGQGGARLFARMGASEEILADDDAHWKFGIFYFNRDDPSLFLPARFGVGWTFNYARPAIWAIMVGGLVLTVAFVVVIMSFG